jgi:predicted DNA-binding protein with PD1-like motif
MNARVSTTGRRIMGRLPKESDLLEALTAVCVHEQITLGEVRAIGAVTRARLGFYDQAKQVYEYLDFDRILELVMLVGNVSLKDGRPFVHAHVTLADHQGCCFGGHLVEGAPVFACEYVIKEYRSETAFKRGPDTPTGLALWEL